MECKDCGTTTDGRMSLCGACKEKRSVLACPSWAEDFGRAHVAQVAIMSGKAWLARRFASVYQHVTIQGKVVVTTAQGETIEGLIVAARKRGTTCVAPGAASGKDFTLLVCHDGLVEVKGPRKEVVDV